MVKAIIFDLWGTILEHGVSPSPSKQVKYFLRARLPFSEFITTFEDTFMTKEYLSLKEGFEAVVKDFNLQIPDFVYEKLVGLWNKNAILSVIYEDTHQALKDLKEAGYKLFLMSNSDKFSFDQVVQKHELEQYFDGFYPSYKSGLLKSNKDAYLNILKENKLKPQDVLVVGDCVVSDINGAQNADLASVLIDRRETREFEPKITTLLELKEYIEKLE